MLSIIKYSRCLIEASKLTDFCMDCWHGFVFSFPSFFIFIYEKHFFHTKICDVKVSVEKLSHNCGSSQFVISDA